MKELSKIEETVLIAIWKLKEEPYGVKIQEQIKAIARRDYLYSTLYTTLVQLVKKGYLVKGYGEPSAVRGGKRKIYFHLTEEGLNALKRAFDTQKSVWNGINEESFRQGLII